MQITTLGTSWIGSRFKKSKEEYQNMLKVIGMMIQSTSKMIMVASITTCSNEKQNYPGKQTRLDGNFETRRILYADLVDNTCTIREKPGNAMSIRTKRVTNKP
jgi:hypothetical protein